jgi:hypothetical protein
MPIDPSIATRIRPAEIPDPMAQYGRAMQLKGMIGQQDLQEMQREELRRDTAERETLAGVYRDALDPDGTLNRPRLLSGVARSGLGAKIPGLQQSFATMDKTGADLANVRSQTSERDLKSRRDGLNFTAQQFGAVLSNPNWTDDDIVGAAARIAASGAMPAEQVKSVIDTFPWGNRAALEQRLRQGITSAMSAADQLAAQMPKLVERSDGQVKSFADVNPLTNPGGPAPLQMRATPESMLTDERARTEGGLNRGVTMRGQNLTDARARETQGAADRAVTYQQREDGSYVALPTRVAPGASVTGITVNDAATGAPLRGKGATTTLTEGQSKALVFGSRMADADRAMRAAAETPGGVLSGATDRPGYIKRTAQATVGMMPIVGDKLSAAAGSALNFTQSDAQQSVENAEVNFLTAVLRRESGAVISPSEFATGELLYFPRLGDSPQRIAQKARNRQMATQGILMEVPEAQRGSVLNQFGMTAPGAARPPAGGPAGAAPGGRPPLTAFERP